MNYLAHGHAHLDRPWFLAGTALPDWVRVCGSRIPCSSHPRILLASSATSPDGGPRAELAAGVLRHHRDDRLFHAAPAFARAQEGLRAILVERWPREALPRPRFVAHILCELLLDRQLVLERPDRIHRYQEALRTLDPNALEEIACRWAPLPPGRLSRLWLHLTRRRLLDDHVREDRVAERVARIVGSTRHPPLPASFREVLPAAFPLVAALSAPLLRAVVDSAPASSTESVAS